MPSRERVRCRSSSIVQMTKGCRDQSAKTRFERPIQLTGLTRDSLMTIRCRRASRALFSALTISPLPDLLSIIGCAGSERLLQSLAEFGRRPHKSWPALAPSLATFRSPLSRCGGLQVHEGLQPRLLADCRPATDCSKRACFGGDRATRPVEITPDLGGRENHQKSKDDPEPRQHRRFDDFALNPVLRTQ